jgi:hypothetical protein
MEMFTGKERLRCLVIVSFPVRFMLPLFLLKCPDSMGISPQVASNSHPIDTPCLPLAIPWANRGTRYWHENCTQVRTSQST